MKINNRFRYIKKLINSNNDIKEKIDNFYYNSKAIRFVDKLHLDYCLNSYYDLTTIDILLMVDENKNVDEVHNNLFEEYETNYATTLWSNFVACLEKEVF